MSKKQSYTPNEIRLIFETAFKTTLRAQKTNELVRCVFHEDSNASMSVNAYKGVYHCFSCGAKGNTRSLIKSMLNGEI